MAVDAVRSEPVSASNSREQGKIQGIFLILAWLAAAEMPLSLCIQEIYCALAVDSACKEQGIKK
jgi:hypothetical protein